MTDAPQKLPQIDTELLERVEQEIQDRQFSLPALPDTAAKVSKAIADPDVTIAQVSKIVTADPVLSGRLIQVANSPIFQGLKRIEDLKLAISRLGLVCVRNLVISLTVNKLFHVKSNPIIKNKLRQCWANSVKVAAIGEVIARGRWRIDPSEALLVGLLHNIGAVPLLNKLAEPKFGVTNEATVNQVLTNLEPQLSKWIMEHWHLRPDLSCVPVLIQDVYKSHAGPANYTDIIQIARLHAIRNTDHPLANIKWGNVPSFQKLEMTPEESLEAIKQAQTEIRSVMSLLDPAK
ncbi:MAG TPA: hypothetical protein DHW71_03310 [Gammaproteobacteria bacterium]|nr:hypothetical protein [Gammaproteobacteria bacterium]MEC8010390.1 HDOD domain-containing protein [Pseudomonadota bacterium]HBF08927.1 hypothetical protein [Gammaproteobacteria bacterium]HCK91986.1 hypothetical protein [Gammaproteobacteria bacterium]|tara:strand:+ start:12627 stop:13499 length:873 start_codon:yes stop_codon:yes gene_type:complete